MQNIKNIYLILFRKNLDFSWPTYSNINHIIAQVLCALTCPIRFPGNQGMTLNDLQTNLVPYPRIHFPVVSYAPLITPEKAYHEELSTAKITAAAFQKNNQLVDVDLRAGRLSLQPPRVLPRGDLTKLQRAVCVASNTTAIRTAWKKLNANFDLLFAKRAFVHWYLDERLDYDEFVDARENLAALVEDYEEVHNDTSEDAVETVYL
ncbi:unnamed protein product [Dibothriocephalus latus]|uniref:Tubulin/FtsZ 2-layer sandwich domain-containing protein n=1 Tax=Dibothriocephalus latus TaxID=60516 RepID=A0A3P7MX61_DIBLA|nr:unnamed protein product [Dibothriocephalus latus]